MKDLKNDDRKICMNCRDWEQDNYIHPVFKKRSHWGICKSCKVSKNKHDGRYFNSTCRRFCRKDISNV